MIAPNTTIPYIMFNLSKLLSLSAVLTVQIYMINADTTSTIAPGSDDMDLGAMLDGMDMDLGAMLDGMGGGGDDEASQLLELLACIDMESMMTGQTEDVNFLNDECSCTDLVDLFANPDSGGEENEDSTMGLDKERFDICCPSENTDNAAFSSCVTQASMEASNPIPISNPADDAAEDTDGTDVVEDQAATPTNTEEAEDGGDNSGMGVSFGSSLLVLGAGVVIACLF